MEPLQFRRRRLYEVREWWILNAAVTVYVVAVGCGLGYLFYQRPSLRYLFITLELVYATVLVFYIVLTVGCLMQPRWPKTHRVFFLIVAWTVVLLTLLFMDVLVRLGFERDDAA